MFSDFPDGLPGVGLALLRAALGGVLTIRAVASVTGLHDPNTAIISILLLAVIGGLSLITGYQTRLAAIAAALAIVASTIFLTGSSRFELFNTRTAAALAIAIAAALACLGPGSFSLDSRLFGRREIIIPKPLHRE